MALFDAAAAQARSEAVSWVHHADAGLREFSERLSAGVDEVRVPMTVGSDLAFERVRAPTTPPGGFYGAGLVRVDPAGAFEAAVIVMPELMGVGPDELRIMHAAEGAPVVEILREKGIAPPPDGWIVAVPQGREQAAGIRVECDILGTLGCPVWLPGNIAGVLTAGHVAKTVGAPARVAGAEIGIVVSSNYLDLGPFPDGCVDVAAIRLTDPDVPRLPGFSATGAAADLERLVAVNTSGVGAQGELVRIVCARYALDERGSWADVALVDAAISEGGDSGSAVVNADGLVIGQIVGGKEYAYSLVQGIDALLAQSKTTFRSTAN